MKSLNALKNWREVLAPMSPIYVRMSNIMNAIFVVDQFTWLILRPTWIVRSIRLLEYIEY